MSDDRARFDDLRFLFACDKLDHDDAAWMRDQLRRHPALEEEVAAERKLAGQLQAAVSALYAATPPLLTCEEVMAAANAAPAQRWPALRAWISGLGQASRRAFAPSWSTGVMAALALCICVQTYRVEQFTSDIGDTRYRGGAVAASDIVLLKVVFADTATFGQLRALTSASQLEVVAGPDPQGVVVMRVANAQATKAVEALRTSAIVLDVSFVGPAPGPGAAP